MNRRKLVFIALLLALPLAILFPMRALRSWQPRALQLAPAGLLGEGGVNLLWRPSGLLLCGGDKFALGTPPSVVTANWDGEPIAVRFLPAGRCDLDAPGALAAWRQAITPDDKVELWDVPNARETAASKVLGAQPDSARFGLKALALSPDGARVAGSLSFPRFAKPNAIGISDARTGRARARFVMRNRDEKGQQVSVEICALAWAPDGAQLAVACPSRVWILDGQNGRLLRAWNKTRDSTTRALWSPDGESLGLASGHGAWPKFDVYDNGPSTRTFLAVHDARDGKVRFRWAQYSGSTREAQGVTNFDFAPDSASIAWGTFDGSALLANFESGQIEREFPPITAPAPATTMGRGTSPNFPSYVAYAPDGRTLAVAARDKITLWRIK